MAASDATRRDVMLWRVCLEVFLIERKAVHECFIVRIVAYFAAMNVAIVDLFVDGCCKRECHVGYFDIDSCPVISTASGFDVAIVIV